MNQYRIMIVDDEPDILDLLEKALKMEGFDHIIKIDRGFLAVNTCKEISPDIIILDIMLPDLDGYEVCRQIAHSRCARFCFFPLNDEMDKILAWLSGR